MNEALRLLRVYHDMKGAELADKLGISASYLSELEKGKRKISIDLLRKYAQVFNTTPSAILVFSDAYEKDGPKLKRFIGRKMVELLGAIEDEGFKDLPTPE